MVNVKQETLELAKEASTKAAEQVTPGVGVYQ